MIDWLYTAKLVIRAPKHFWNIELIIILLTLTLDVSHLNAKNSNSWRSILAHVSVLVIFSNSVAQSRQTPLLLFSRTLYESSSFETVQDLRLANMIPGVAGTISNVTGLPITVGSVKILRSYFDKLSIVLPYIICCGRL